MYGSLRSTTEDTMQGLVDSQMGLLAGDGNVASKIHGGQKMFSLVSTMMEQETWLKEILLLKNM